MHDMSEEYTPHLPEMHHTGIGRDAHDMLSLYSEGAHLFIKMFGWMHFERETQMSMWPHHPTTSAETEQEPRTLLLELPRLQCF